MEEENNEYLKLSVEDRCQHKLWKARVSGYEDAAKLFSQQTDEKSPEFSKYLGLIKKFVTDSNAAAQEKGIVAALAYVENAACAGKTCSDVVSGVIAKGIAASRTKTRELSLELILLYIEIEKQEAVQEELIKGLESKSPKVVSSCIAALREALHCFGSQVVSLKPIVKVLPKLLEDRDKSVRDESKQLCVEVYRWAGEAIKPQLQTLKPVTLTELESEFEKVKGERPAATRYLKSQQEKPVRDAVDGGTDREVGEIAASSAVPEIDPFDLMTAVDVLAKLPKDFYEQCEAKKWQERKEALEALLQMTTNVKLESGDYSELVRTLKKMVAKDTNVVVVALACRCLTNIILGLRKKFQSYCGPCVPVILEKFKEKKPNVVQALREAADAIYSITTLEALLEDIQAALANKNPQIKAETAAFLTRCFTNCTPLQLNKKIVKPLTASLIKTLNDTDGVVRDNSAEALGTALKVVGERVMGPLLQEVDALKMAKVKECCDKAVIVAKPQAVETKVERMGSPASEKSSSAGSAKPVPVPRNAPMTKRAASAPVAKPKAVGRPAKAAAKKASADVVIEPEFTERELSDEDVLQQASELLPDDVIGGLSSSNWKERLSAVEKFHEVVQQTEKGKIPAQALVKLLAKKPGFKENNFQILKLRFEILTNIADNASISQCTIECCLGDIVDKIGDAKNGASAGAALCSLAGATSLEYISQKVLAIAFAQRNPRNQAESLIWLSTAIKQFGLKIQMKEVIDYLKKAFSSTNPTVKAAALTLVGTLFMYVGRNLRSFFEDEKPALLQQIDAEMERVKDLKPPLPERGLKAKSGTIGSAGDGGQGHGGHVDLSDLVPRVDISGQITSQLLSDLADKDWHLRLDALQKISTIISDAKFILPNLGDLPTALKPRLTDTNKKLAVQALSVCQALGAALGNQCSKQLRNFAPGILAALGDNKANIRTCAVQCLNSWMDNCPVSSLFEGEMVSEALRADNPFLRVELFSWLAEKLPSASSVPASELSQCLPSLFSCLEDRNADVRKKASECLLPFMTHVGYECMVRQASKLKPSSKANVVGQLEKIRPCLPEKPSKSKLAKPSSAQAVGRGSPPSPTGVADDDGVTSGRGALNRSTSKSKIAQKAVPAAAAKSKKDEDVDNSPPLVVNNLKDQRLIDEKALRVLRWNFTTPREEFYLQLKDQMITANCNRTLVSYCFHNDFKFHLKAIDIFLECLENNVDATIANLDLILKWLALRFFDTNPSVLMKGLEYLQMLFEVLQSQKYRLIDAEAASFVPYLILKIGDPKDTVRKGVKEIIGLICKVYPSSKMFSYIMQGISSKNARQRAECLDELGQLIELCGISVCQPSPAVALKEIAKQISDRDNAVRNAALNCVVQAFFLEGEKIYKYVGSLSDKDMSLLEERIKRCAKNRPLKQLRENANEPSVQTQAVRTSPSAQQSSQEAESKREGSPRSRSKGPITLDLDDIEQMFKPKEPKSKLPELVPVDADAILNLPDIQLPQTRLRPPASALKLLNNSSEATTAVNLVMAQLTAQEIPVAVEAFAQVEELLRQDDRAEAVMGTRVDQLLVMGALQYRLAHNKHMADENICKADVIRLYRCVTMALVSLFDHPSLAKKASRDVLRDLIPHLVTVILDSRLNELQEGPQVVRTINVLIIRILQRSNPTNIMSALIKLLHDCVGNMNASERFTDLIMKCLWKMIRMFRQLVDELNVDRILLDLHVFLKAYPSSSWKERPVDTPIRTVKTILYTLVEILGDDIMKHLMLIPNKQESDLFPYLQKLLRMRKEKSGRSSKDEKSSQEDNSGSKEGHKRNKSSSLKLSKSTHEALTEIFKKIGSKEQTKEGLQELYEFMNNHPEANIEPFLQRSSDFFQNYIRQGIKEIEQQQKTLKSSGQTALISSPDVVPKTTSTMSHASWGGSNTLDKKYSEYLDNEKGSTESWREMFLPVPPPTSDTTPMDWGEWLKIIVARMGMDTTKYNNPEYMNALLGITSGMTDDELCSEKAIQETVKKSEELAAMVAELKNRVNV